MDLWTARACGCRASIASRGWAHARFIVVTGVPWFVPKPGQMWDDPSLQAAVQVADAVEPKRDAFRLVSIDVSNFGYRRDRRDTEIALYTASGTRIKWGKAALFRSRPSSGKNAR